MSQENIEGFGNLSYAEQQAFLARNANRYKMTGGSFDGQLESIETPLVGSLGKNGLVGTSVDYPSVFNKSDVGGLMASNSWRNRAGAITDHSSTPGTTKYTPFKEAADINYSSGQIDKKLQIEEDALNAKTTQNLISTGLAGINFAFGVKKYRDTKKRNNRIDAAEEAATAKATARRDKFAKNVGGF